MQYALSGKMQTKAYNFDSVEQKAAINIDSFTRDSKLEFGYCTEFLLRLMTEKCDPDAFEVSTVIKMLEELGGESIVAYKTDDVLKVHVHTFDPGRVLTEARAYGEFLTVKIENMSVSHSGEENSEKPKKNKKRKKFSVITVATGEGLCSLFTHIGADGIISGGQTANPSTEEFIEAFEKYDAENIIVLPNNKNVFLAAKQASELYDKAKIHIVPTESIMQGYGALSVITPGISDVEMLVKNATAAASGVIGAEITRAVRDVTINTKTITTGDYIAISGPDILAVSDTAEDALVEMINETPELEDMEILTVFVGKDVDEERRADITERLEEEFPELEVTVYGGGQDVYDYLVALE
jgi:dihydroxyacetone kinase-like predicted kinase